MHTGNIKVSKFVAYTIVDVFLLYFIIVIMINQVLLAILHTLFIIMVFE
jgi:hypothetical protein